MDETAKLSFDFLLAAIYRPRVQNDARFTDVTHLVRRQLKRVPAVAKETGAGAETTTPEVPPSVERKIGSGLSSSSFSSSSPSPSGECVCMFGHACIHHKWVLDPVACPNSIAWFTDPYPGTVKEVVFVLGTADSGMLECSFVVWAEARVGLWYGSPVIEFKAPFGNTPSQQQQPPSLSTATFSSSSSSNWWTTLQEARWSAVAWAKEAARYTSISVNVDKKDDNSREGKEAAEALAEYMAETACTTAVSRLVDALPLPLPRLPVTHADRYWDVKQVELLVLVHQYDGDIKWAERIGEKSSGKIVHRVYGKEGKAGAPEEPFCAKNVAKAESNLLKFCAEFYDILPPYVAQVYQYEHKALAHTGSLLDILNAPDLIERTKNNPHTPGFLHLNSVALGSIVPQQERMLFSGWWDATMRPWFGEIRALGDFTLGKKASSQFVVSRERIRSLPRAFYEDMYRWLVAHNEADGEPFAFYKDSCTRDASAKDRENLRSPFWTSRYLEWTWQLIFTIFKPSERGLVPFLTVHSAALSPSSSLSAALPPDALWMRDGLSLADGSELSFGSPLNFAPHGCSLWVGVQSSQELAEHIDGFGDAKPPQKASADGKLLTLSRVTESGVAGSSSPPTVMNVATTLSKNVPFRALYGTGRNMYDVSLTVTRTFWNADKCMFLFPRAICLHQVFGDPIQNSYKALTLDIGPHRFCVPEERTADVQFSLSLDLDGQLSAHVCYP